MLFLIRLLKSEGSSQTHLLVAAGPPVRVGAGCLSSCLGLWGRLGQRVYAETQQKRREKSLLTTANQGVKLTSLSTIQIVWKIFQIQLATQQITIYFMAGDLHILAASGWRLVLILCPCHIIILAVNQLITQGYYSTCLTWNEYATQLIAFMAVLVAGFASISHDLAWLTGLETGAQRTLCCSLIMIRQLRSEANLIEVWNKRCGQTLRAAGGVVKGWQE